MRATTKSVLFFFFKQFVHVYMMHAQRLNVTSSVVKEAKHDLIMPMHHNIYMIQVYAICKILAFPGTHQVQR